MQRRTSVAMLALVSSAGLITACGSSSSSTGASQPNSVGSSTGTTTSNSSQAPSAELTSAVSALGKDSSLTSTIKIGASASQLIALSKANGGSAISQAEANAVSGGSVAIEVQAPKGKTLADLNGASANAGAVAFTVNGSGTTYVSVRSLNQTLYVQLDAKGLLTALGHASTVQQLQSASAELPPFVQALLNGKWVSLPSSTLKQLESQSGTPATASPSQEKAFVSALENALTKDVTVKRASSGGTDTLTITGNTKTLSKDFVSALTSAEPSAASVLGEANLGKTPSKTVTLTAQVTGGALSEVTIDLGQFSNKGQSIPLNITFASGGSTISAPSGATPVDTSELGSLLGAAGSGSL